MNQFPTTFDALFFKQCPPPVPQPIPRFFDPRTGLHTLRAWPDQRVAVDLFHASTTPKYPDEIDGFPVITDALPEDQIVAFAPSWRTFRYSWDRFLNSPEPIINEIFITLVKTSYRSGPFVEITERDRYVLRMIARGIPYNAIGQAIGRSSKTVASIVLSMKDKLLAESAPALVARAITLGIITSEDIFLELSDDDPDRFAPEKRQKTVRN